MYVLIKPLPAQSAEAVEYTVCISAEGYDSPLHECPVMTLNNLMVKLQ